MLFIAIVLIAAAVVTHRSDENAELQRFDGKLYGITVGLEAFGVRRPLDVARHVRAAVH